MDDTTSTAPLAGGSPRPARRMVIRGLLAAAGAAHGAAPALAAAPPAAASLDNAVTVSAARLDELVATQHAVFNQGQVLRPFDAATQGAGSAVRLHRITTWTRLPGTGEAVKVSGLLAVPADATGTIPVVSWQHGTLLAFDPVPSNLTRIAAPGYALRENVDSAETLFNIHRFASHGFAVIAADYLGKGPYRDGRPEAYVVKEASTQTCIDVLDAGLAGLRTLGLEAGPLFLNGWSQGGLNTQWMAQALQDAGRPVRAASAQSPFNDLNATLRYWTGVDTHAAPTAAPYPAVPDWVSLGLVIVLGSYQAYYGIDGLLDAAVRPEYRDFARTFWTGYGLDFDPARHFPSTRELLVDGFFQRFTAEQNSLFLRRMAANRSTYIAYAAPMRFYYGLADEALHAALAQRPLSAGGAWIDGIAVPGASHRVTFLASLYGSGAEVGGTPDLLQWFRARGAG